MECVLSIIIPVYGVEKYLSTKCSILQENMGVETTGSCIDSKMDYGKVSQDKAG